MKKKWIGAAALLLIAAIGLFALNVHNRDADYYLEWADKYVRQGNYDLTIINLEQALEKSKKTYGDASVETADIYRKLGGIEKNQDTACEYFDKAILIYEIEGKADAVPEILCEKGFMYANKGGAFFPQAMEIFQTVIDDYRENGYEDVTALCISYCMAAQFSEAVEEQLEYLKKAEQLLERVRPEKKFECSETVYEGTASVTFYNKDYRRSLDYWEKLLELTGDAADNLLKQKKAESYQMSGACLAYLGETEEAEAQLKTAVGIYEEIGSSVCYDGLALSYASLALTYAGQGNAGTEKMQEYGKNALACYTERESITNIDIANMEALRPMLQDAYEMAYPEQSTGSFDSWFSRNSQMKATSYHFYTQ